MSLPSFVFVKIFPGGRKRYQIQRDLLDARRSQFGENFFLGALIVMPEVRDDPGRRFSFTLCNTGDEGFESIAAQVDRPRLSQGGEHRRRFRWTVRHPRKRRRVRIKLREDLVPHVLETDARVRQHPARDAIPFPRDQVFEAQRDKLPELLMEHFVVDGAKARTELGFAPKVTFRDGAKLTAAWYRRERWD